MANQWQQVNNLFLRALDLAPGERAEFLAQACADDETLRRDVESLLASHAQASQFLEQPLIDAAALVEQRCDGETGPALPADDLVGRIVASYRIDARLGAGGMGEVYKAHDLKLDRPVALKLLPRHITVDAERLRRARLEARAASSLNHPHIVVVHDFGEEGERPFMVTEYVAGQTLRERLDHGAMPIPELVEVAVQIASALAAAHEQGVLHRDIKPENVMVRPDGYVKVLDFGLAKLMTPDENVPAGQTETAVGVIMGTPRYMSPEQARGERVTLQSDQFSFGVLLYEMATGHPPFQRTSAIETAAAVITAQAEPLASACPHMPSALRDIVERCLAKDADGRFPSTRDLYRDLVTVQRGSSDGHASAATPQLAGRRPRFLAWVTLTAGLVGGAFLLVTRSIPPFGPSGSPFGNPTSIAVLPLINASGNDETEYLSDGISDALINRLSQLPQLRVMARGTVFSYKGREVDPRRIGEELNVRVVFSGRLTQRDDTTIIQANLANAENGAQIWGERYTRTIADLSGLQEILAEHILNQLQLDLTGEQQDRLAKRDTKNAAAYKLFLEGRYHANRLTMDGLKRGIDLMNQAVALDPTYAVAHAGLADVYADASGIYLSAGEAMSRARAAAEHALRLDSNLAGAHALLGFFKGTQDWQWTHAEEELKRTITLNPSYARAHEAYGHILMMQGRTAEAIAAMMHARDLDPRNALINANVGWFHYLAREHQEAVAWSQRLLKLDPKLVAAHYNLGMAYEQMGRHSEAVAAFEEARNLDPTNWPAVALLCYAYGSSGDRQRAHHLLAELTQHATHRRLDPAWIGLLHGVLGDQQQAFDWLEKAFHARSDLLLFLKVDPKFDTLRSHPRFEDLVKRLNLLPER